MVINSLTLNILNNIWIQAHYLRKMLLYFPLTLLNQILLNQPSVHRKKLLNVV